MAKRRLAAIMSVDVVGYSRMMEEAPSGLLSALNDIFRSLIKPLVDASDGRVVKLMGDGALIEFRSAHDALTTAAAIQQRMLSEPPPYSFGKPIFLRIGIHAGDIIVEGQDIFGSGINIASRLQSEAEAGGVLLSKTVADLAGPDVAFNLRREGLRRLKNLSDPVDTLSIDFSNNDLNHKRHKTANSLEVRFCHSADGQTLAWTSVGDGGPLVRAPAWISHLEFLWRDPGYAHWMDSFSRSHRLVFFDARGNGLSDWDMKAISFDSLVDDLESVFDAAGIQSAPVLAHSQGCAIAVSFAARRPERVSAIVMTGAYVQGRARRRSKQDQEKAKALRAMMKAGWDDDYPSLRDLIAETVVPLASNEDRLQYAADMRQMISAANLGRYREVVDNLDVTPILSEVQAPCLVLHSKGDRMHPIEQGRKMAAGIPNAKFIALDSINHNITENDPCWPLIEREIHSFLAEHSL